MPHRAGDLANEAFARRRQAGAEHYAGHRPEPRADGSQIPARRDANVSEISTRVRVNNYTDVHAVAELSDGKLYMVKTYVKASGGCSAPAAKNADEAKGRLGQMRYRQFGKAGEGPASGAREAQIMIGHPNIPACRWTRSRNCMSRPSSSTNCGFGRTTAWC